MIDGTGDGPGARKPSLENVHDAPNQGFCLIGTHARWAYRKGVEPGSIIRNTR